MKATFSKKEKLKSTKEIELLFQEGQSLKKFPVLLVYRESSDGKEIGIKAAVSVSKKKFKRAVDRNRIKRLLREAYRLQKAEVLNECTRSYSLMLIYIGKEMPDYHFLSKKINFLLNAFAEKVK
ncbi:ribonuclease P protein component [Aquimarina sp. ERC-38]|uniref:ribonuclease P protein component n=1 Tax=Aquimarina sp. ERC-38 TaxID=2949996 RepID=UPI0022481397|nr:ribonuclease P protein component [Aquimarina sp. ERC-38]UZO81823.1 ribonuclease P protein component [Aquimarina sp. ERC-38]